ncbi:hypothetical protein ACPCHT_39000, partial [Nucisporomicrobium flavum]|uniref:hypothetical protein n=1 Tax=Nucisporomicrobium flavum TaxID=2785915 RepID=UPI003C2C1D35
MQCQMSPASPRQGQTVAITFTIDSPNSRTVGLGVGVYADGSENGTVPGTVFPARHAGLSSGGMGTVSDDIERCE